MRKISKEFDEARRREESCPAPEPRGEEEPGDRPSLDPSPE